MGYWYLTIAIIAEVLATSALKESQGFSRLVPSLVVAVGYGASFYFLSLVLQTIPIGVAYALWAGLGIVLITLVGAVMFGQTMDLPAILGIALIVSGVVVLRVFSSVEAELSDPSSLPLMQFFEQRSNWLLDSSAREVLRSNEVNGQHPLVESAIGRLYSPLGIVVACH